LLRLLKLLKYGTLQVMRESRVTAWLQADRAELVTLATEEELGLLKRTQQLAEEVWFMKHSSSSMSL